MSTRHRPLIAYRPIAGFIALHRRIREMPLEEFSL
jgi:hypothetical protein